MRSNGIIVKVLSPVLLFCFMLATVGFDVHYSRSGNVSIVLSYETSDCEHIHPQEACHDSHSCCHSSREDALSGVSGRGACGHCIDELHQLTVCGPVSALKHLQLFACALPSSALQLAVCQPLAFDFPFGGQLWSPHPRSPQFLPLRI